MSGPSRKTTDILGRIQSRMKAVTPENVEAAEVAAAPSPATPRETGFVGKVLSTSNKSLDAQIEEANRVAEASKAEASELRAKLESGEVAVKIDPRRVRASAFPDRHPNAFQDKEFLDFIEEIRATDGNREPGVVRPIQGDPDYDYELAAGHRRHKACLASNKQFFTFIREMSDEELFICMSTENKGRKDLSSFELGRHYAALLANHKFAGIRAMSTALNVPLAVMHRLTSYGDLPEAVVEAFPDPRAIRIVWVKPLLDAYTKDTATLTGTASRLRADTTLSPAEIFKRLTGSTSKPSIVAGSDRVLASVRMIHDRKAIVLYKDAPDELLEKLKGVIEAYHKEHNEDAP